jgi:hypothetical protein
MRKGPFKKYDLGIAITFHTVNKVLTATTISQSILLFRTRELEISHAILLFKTRELEKSHCQYKKSKRSRKKIHYQYKKSKKTRKNPLTI